MTRFEYALGAAPAPAGQLEAMTALDPARPLWRLTVMGGLDGNKHDAPVQQLRVTMPISVRTDRDVIGGNRITLARFTLPLDIAGTADLMLTVDALVADWRRSRR